jgi:hypothetical protein
MMLAEPVVGPSTSLGMSGVVQAVNVAGYQTSLIPSEVEGHADA